MLGERAALAALAGGPALGAAARRGQRGNPGAAACRPRGARAPGAALRRRTSSASRSPDAAARAASLLGRGIKVRVLRALPGIGDAIRIGVGPWDGMERRLAALREVPQVRVAVLDYGAGNVHSLAQGAGHGRRGPSPGVPTRRPALDAALLVLPGVGAYPAAAALLAEARAAVRERLLGGPAVPGHLSRDAAPLRRQRGGARVPGWASSPAG